MKLSKESLENLYTSMLRIRRAQEKIAEIYPQEPRKIQCPVHLCIGQEAIAAGVCANLLSDDYVLGYFRSHGHYLAKGGDLNALFAELYGKKTGCAKGRGGSMHILDMKAGYMGSSAIVGGLIAQAVGAALAFKLRGEPRVAVSFFGDGACEEGVWHESLNFAALRKLPVIFVCENNFYAVKSTLAARQPLDNIYQRAANYGLPGVRIDGNDVLKVFAATQAAVERARNNQGPTLIEARTYRWRQMCENTFFDKDLLEGRPKKEYAEWLKRDPVKLFEKRLLATKVLNEVEQKTISQKIDQEINEAVRFTEESPFPNSNNLRIV